MITSAGGCHGQTEPEMLAAAFSVAPLANVTTRATSRVSAVDEKVYGMDCVEACFPA